MTANTLMAGWLSALTDAPWGIETLVRATLLLVGAWLLHLLLRPANPRWRVLLWRGTGVGLFLLPLTALVLPPIAVEVTLPQVTEVTAMPARVTATWPMSSIPQEQNLAADQGIHPFQDGGASFGTPPILSGSKSSLTVPLQTETPAPLPAMSVVWFDRFAMGLKQSAMWIGVWLLGTLIFALRWLVSWILVHRLLAGSQSASPAAMSVLDRVAIEIGSRRMPSVRVVEKSQAPARWVSSSQSF